MTDDPARLRATPIERRAAAAGPHLDAADLAALSDFGPLGADRVERMIENAVGVFAVPLGIAEHLLIDGVETRVAMATEESSVIAAVGNAARRCRPTGGFTTSYSGSLTIAQMQILDLSDPFAGKAILHERAAEALALADACDPVLVENGGGARRLEARVLDAPEGPMLVAHLVVDTRDAMGANAVNTMAETLGPVLANWTGGRCLLRILSNLADQRIARARAVWPAAEIGGAETVAAILAAARLAEIDPYRAATHNKGVMNGVSAVTLATGNDTRAVEAGAHAYAARGGRYASLTRWERRADGALSGSIELPMPVGVVGGATRTHPTAQAVLRLMGVDGAERLARVIAAVGLAQNFGALRALATVGIQRGHMSLHATNVAVAAGARGEEVDALAGALRRGGVVREDVARRLLAEMRAVP